MNGNKKDVFMAKTLSKNELEIIKEEIRHLEWDENINWVIQINHGLRLPIKEKPKFRIETIYLNPCKECSIKNPLYKHKEWLERIYKNKKWNLNDSLIGKICRVNKTTIRKHRIKFKIKTKNKLHKGWFIDSKGYKQIMINGGKFIPEHILIMIQYLKNNLDTTLTKKYLVRVGYDYKLIDSAIVHHINYVKLNKRIEKFIYL